LCSKLFGSPGPEFFIHSTTQSSIGAQLLVARKNAVPVKQTKPESSDGNRGGCKDYKHFQFCLMLKFATVSNIGRSVLGRVLINAAANVRFQSEVDMIRQAKPAGSVENDPQRTSE
jgi:hypothetical protein